MMRSGCDDAEKIQKHCAIALCNSLSVWLKKEVSERALMKTSIREMATYIIKWLHPLLLN